MPGFGVAPRYLSGCQAVVHMTPVVRANISRIEPNRFHLVDCLQNTLDNRPPVLSEQQLAARVDTGNSLERSMRCDRTHNVDARNGGAVIVRRPPHEGEYTARREHDDARSAIQAGLTNPMAKPNPVFDPTFNPGQLNPCGIGCFRRVAISCDDISIRSDEHGVILSAGCQDRAKGRRSVWPDVRCQRPDRRWMFSRRDQPKP